MTLNGAIKQLHDLRCAEDMPMMDVQEVRHGRWIQNDIGTYSCSLCQSWILKGQRYYARYCLYCGALMDMEGEAEEGEQDVNTD